jgi:hypothetical protein
MPSIVGAVRIVSVGSSAIIQFGDCILISPSSSTKSYAGAGSFVTGDLPRTNNAVSGTLTNDPDVSDNSASKII